MLLLARNKRQGKLVNCFDTGVKREVIRCAAVGKVIMGFDGERTRDARGCVDYAMMCVQVILVQVSVSEVL